MEEKTKQMAEQPEKMSYEQLENVAHQLSEQAKQLYTKLQESNLQNVFKRLDYLFKVLEYHKAFDAEFVLACSNEIVDLMTVPKDEQQDTKNEDIE